MRVGFPEEAVEEIIERIDWLGWTTTLGDLAKAGWKFHHSPPYCNWRDGSSPGISNYHFYLRHDKHRLIARITFPQYDIGRDDFRGNMTLDYLTHERNGKVKPPRYDIPSGGEESIPQLLDKILQIQGPAKKRNKPKANVIGFPEINTARRIIKHG